MDRNYILFPSEFLDETKKKLIVDFSSLENLIIKLLKCCKDADFRILLNRKSPNHGVVSVNISSVIKNRIPSSDIYILIPNEIYNSGLLQRKEITSISVHFFEKAETEVVSKLEQFVCSGNRNSDGFVVGKGLSSFFPTDPKWTFDKIYMSQSQKKDILRTLNTLKNHELIYKTWGFEEIDPAARSILNFYGPPGTGKTMTAHAIAAELGIKILELNYAEIESKYVGDAAKNMVNAFNTAKKENALLFFDEADSFLSRRSTSGTSSSEQSMNSQRSQLLMLLENFKGIVVFCTNLIKNYDSAFESRILKSIKFELPDENARKEILKKSIPVKLPFKNDKILQEDDYCELAKIIEGFSGREIKNAVLKTLCFVAEKEEKCFEFADFKLCFENAKKEFDEMKSARGPNKEKLAQEISENLKNKNYAEAKEKSASSVEQ